MKRALITGITGQDGILLAENLLGRGYAVAGVARAASFEARPQFEGTLAGVGRFAGDATDGEILAEAITTHAPDEIYHLAAQSAPGASWDLSIETTLATGLGAHHLFEAVRRHRPTARVFQASSSEMFGHAAQTPQRETTPFAPANPYAAAKTYAHHMAGIYRHSHGLFIACGILYNHESPLRSMRFVSQKIAHGAACARLGLKTSPLRNEAGEPVVKDGRLALGWLDAARDWGHARDTVEAMRRMLQADQARDYVVGTGVLRSVRDFAAAAYGSVGLDYHEYLVSDPRLLRPSEAPPALADSALARIELGWEPTISFPDMVGEMVQAQLALLEKNA